MGWWKSFIRWQKAFSYWNTSTSLSIYKLTYTQSNLHDGSLNLKIICLHEFVISLCYSTCQAYHQTVPTQNM